VFTFLERILHVPSEFTLILGGLGLIIAAIQNPEGIAGGARQIGQAIKAKRSGAVAAAPRPATQGGH
jgi:branched-chain amino acid transport system permease protein